jgi:hypothetical protein
MTLSAIMTSPDFGEVCFLIALIFFVIATALSLVKTEAAAYSGTCLAAGLAFIALAWLAL